MEKNVEINVGRDVTGKIVLGDLIIKNSYNKIKDSNIDLANAIEELGTHIANTDESNHDSEKVTDIFRELQQKIANDDKPHMIEMLWNTLVALVPSVNSLTSAASAIKSLFS